MDKASTFQVNTTKSSGPVDATYHVGGGLTGDDGSFKRIAIFHGNSISLQVGLQYTFRSQFKAICQQQRGRPEYHITDDPVYMMESKEENARLAKDIDALKASSGKN